MHNYKFILNGTQDITDHILQFNYSDNLDDFASSFSFDYVSLDPHGDLGITSEINGQEVINEIRLVNTNNTTVYLGYITDSEHGNDENKFTYSGFDVGFYLNKNEILRQFDKENIGDAIDALCGEFGINLEERPNFTQTISRIFKDVSFSDAVKELIQFERIAGGRDDFYIDCKNGNFAIREYQVNQQLGSWIMQNIPIDSFQTVNNVNVKHSVQNLKNRVIYTDSDDTSLARVTSQDAQSIATYGLLTEVEQVDFKSTNNIGQLAQNRLNELNRVSDTISLSMLGDEQMRKGTIIPLNIPQYSLTGTYLITSASHTIDAQNENVDISIMEREA